MRSRARAPLQVRAADRRRRRRRGADEDLGDVEALLHGRGDGGHDRCGTDPRRLRLHAGVPPRADDAGREDHADLRGHEPDPAARDRAGDGEGEPYVPARRGDVGAMGLAADSQRERAVAALRRHYQAGRLEVEDFAERAERALRARTTGELRAALRDLPRLGEAVERGRAAAGAAAYIAVLAFAWILG